MAEWSSSYPDDRCRVFVGDGIGYARGLVRNSTLNMDWRVTKTVHKITGPLASNSVEPRASSQNAEPTVGSRSDLVLAVSRLHRIAVERQCPACQCAAIGSSVILGVSGNFGIRFGPLNAHVEQTGFPEQGNAWRSDFSVKVDDTSELGVTLVEAGLVWKESDFSQPSTRQTTVAHGNSFTCARSYALMRLGEADRRVAQREAQSGCQSLSADVGQCDALTLIRLRELFCLAAASEYASAIAIRNVHGYRIHKFCEPPPGQRLCIHTEVYRDPSEISSMLSLRSSIHLAGSLQVVAVSETLFR